MTETIEVKGLQVPVELVKEYAKVIADGDTGAWRLHIHIKICNSVNKDHASCWSLHDLSIFMDEYIMRPSVFHWLVSEGLDEGLIAINLGMKMTKEQDAKGNWDCICDYEDEEKNKEKNK